MARVSVWRFLVPVAAVLAGACSDDGDSAARADPATVVEGYVAAYNAQDIDKVMTFFAEDAVIVGAGDRLGGAERIEGAAAIRASEQASFGVHAPGGDAYSISNLTVTGDTATWDHHFKGTAHTCVGTDNEAVVEDGRIVLWNFPSISCD